MCGIGGFYSTTGGSAPVESIEALWKALEGRGTHAAGFALNWRDSDEPIVRKKACRASKMTGELRRLCGSGDNTHYVMLHTRYTTQGSTDNNANNHPVVRDGIVLTHNGVLHNDDEVFAILDLERTAQVDTEAINASLRHLGTQWTVENVEGSMSIAWVDTQESTKTVHLMTNGNNPLVIARLTSGDIVWASTEDILWEALGEVLDPKSIFNALPYKQYTLNPDGTIRSKFVSEQRAEPYTGMNWGRWVSSHYGTSTRTTGRAQKPSRPMRQKRRKMPKKHAVWALCDHSKEYILVETDDPDLYYTNRGWCVGTP